MTFTPVMYYKAGRSTFAMTRAEAVDLEYNGWVKNPTATPPPADPPPTGGTGGTGGGTGLVLGTTATTAKRGDYVPSWLEVTAKPTTFPPDSHVHTVNSLSDASVVGKSVLTAASAAAIRTLLGVDTGTGSSGLTLGTTATTAKAGNYVPAWVEITGKPVAFVPTTHQHGAADLSGVVKTINGAAPDGTGNVPVVIGDVVRSTDPNSRGKAGSDPSVLCLFVVPGSVQPPAMLPTDIWYSSLIQ